RVVGRDTVAAAGLAVGGFVMGTPFALLTPLAFGRGVLDELREVHTVQFGNEAALPGYLFNLGYSLPEALGWPLYLLALAGLAWALVVRGGREAVVLRVTVPYLLVIGTWSSRFERYVIPLLPSLTLLGAVALTQGVRWLAARTHVGRRPWPAVALGTVSALVLAPALGRAVAYHRLLARPDTRVLGSSWVEREVPPGAKIALEPFSLTLPVARRQLHEAPESLKRLQPLRPAVLAPTDGGRDDGYWLVRLDTY